MHKKYIDQLKGICSVLVTPLNEDETLDKDGFRRLVNYQRINDINSIFVCGASGEGAALSHYVRSDALSIALEEFPNRPILVGIFESGTKKAVEEINKLSSTMGDNKNVFLMVAPPIYFSASHSENEILNFYKSICSTGIPTMIYSNTKYTGLALTLEQIKRLSQEENIIGIKFTKEPMGILEDLIKNTKDKDFKIGFAKNEPLVKSFEMGVHLLVNTAATVIPKTFSMLYLNYTEGRIEEARSLEREISLFERFYSIGPSVWASAKSASSIVTGCKEYMSKPFEMTSPEKRVELEKFMRSVNLTYPIF